jgi:DNA uptake protein ComE-like DNA-binding protein
MLILCGVAGVIAAGAGGCRWNNEDQQQRNKKTREDVARATEKAKPAIEKAGKEIGHAAEAAAEEAHAAAQGVKEGWERGREDRRVEEHRIVNLNSASERELMDLPGITRDDARKIIEGRPYRNRHELVSKGILSESEYAKVRDATTVK